MVSFTELFGRGDALNVLGWSVGLALLSIFIWYFYRSISKRNLINLNLKKYNYSEHPLGGKFFAIVLYLVEYVVIMPLLIGLWFIGLSIVLYLLGSQNVEYVLFVAVVLIGAIRILAFFNDDIANDLAKLFPFIALSSFLLSPNEVFSKEVLTSFFETALSIPVIVNNVLIYFVVVIGIEVFLRLIYTMYEFWVSEEGETFDPRK